MERFVKGYLCQHTEIKDVLFIIEDASCKNYINNIINSVVIKNCFASSLYADEFNIKNCEFIKFSSLNQFLEANPDCVLVYCSKKSNTRLLANLLNLRPRFVIFEFQQYSIDTFSVWEKFKNYAKHIIIAKPRTPSPRSDYIIRDWHSRETDIELSVILPVYKVAKFLPKCIASLTKWKANYIEFLFVNDGSPDNSRSIIEQYSKHDKRIKLINKSNGGCASARQLGLEKSKGQYVIFIDPDDFVNPSMLKQLFVAATSGMFDIAYCGYYEYYENTKTQKKIKDPIYYPYSKGTDIKPQIDYLIPFMRIGIWREMFSKQLLINENIHFLTNLRRFDDLPFKVETILKAKSVISVNKHLYYYRLGRAGQDVNVNDEKLFVHFDIFKHLDKIFSKANSQQLDYYHIVKLSTHIWALSKLKKNLKLKYRQMAKKDMLSLYNKEQLKNAILAYLKPKKYRQLKKILNTK